MEEQKTGTIFVRTKKERNYTVMDNTFLRDERLSAQAKGVFAYILYLPEDWCIYQTELVKHFKNGKDALRSAIKELEEFGYLSKEHIKDKASGRFTHWQYTVNEIPSTPEADFPKLETPKLDNPPLLNTNNKINTDNNKFSEVDTSDFPEDPNEIKPKKVTRSKKTNTQQYEEYISSLTDTEREQSEKCVDLFIELHKQLDPYYNRDKSRLCWQVEFAKFQRESHRSYVQILQVIRSAMTNPYRNDHIYKPEYIFNNFEDIVQSLNKTSPKSDYQKKREIDIERGNMNTGNRDYSL